MTAAKTSARRAAIVDVGSNTIKILAGEKDPTGLKILHDETTECRISQGMYSTPPLFTRNAMESASIAIRNLLNRVQFLAPDRVEILATSAVRDAGNRDEFVEMVRAQTGLPLTILSGMDEASGIADGIAQEPSLNSESPYSISDLGGGSLEWIYRRDGKIQHLTSMQLGAVRLLHQFLPDPSQPLRESARDGIREHCLSVFRECIPPLALPNSTLHWGTGGAFTITRLLLATENGIPLQEQSKSIPLSEIHRIGNILSALPLEERQTYPGLPATRADILPVALVIIHSLAEFIEANEFHHSFCNLRMGRLARLLEMELKLS